MHKASVLLSIDQELRYVLYGLAISLEAVINAKEVERLFAHSEAGDRTAQAFLFYDGPLAKVSGHVDEYEPETVFLHVESMKLDQQTLEGFAATSKDQAFHPSLTTPRLNLLMLRVADLERAANFYRLLGLEFAKHAHGSGPEHYACELPGFVFELYLATAEQPVSASARLGFAVVGIDQLVTKLAAAGLTILSAPRDSQWGRRAVVVDPDGYRVEMLESRESS